MKVAYNDSIVASSGKGGLILNQLKAWSGQILIHSVSSGIAEIGPLRYRRARKQLFQRGIFTGNITMSSGSPACEVEPKKEEYSDFTFSVSVHSIICPWLYLVIRSRLDEALTACEQILRYKSIHLSPEADDHSCQRDVRLLETPVKRLYTT